MTSSNQENPGILDRLTGGEILVFDGATGTYLQRKGLEPGGCPELMNAEQPEIVQQMARDYFAAGSDIVLTNTFGGNRLGLSRPQYNAGDRVRELNMKAAQNAKSQCPPGKYVAGSVGPTGEFMEPYGTISESEMYEVLAEQISALEEGGADAVMIETQLSLEEAALAVRAAKENTKLVIMASMVFDLGPRGYFTMGGTTPEQAVEGLEAAGAHIVGTNCGNGIERMIEIATRMREATDGYLVVQSNAGIPAIKGGDIEYPESPEYMADHYKTLAALPVNILGGCCGTGPEHIQALAEAVKGLKAHA